MEKKTYLRLPEDLRETGMWLGAYGFEQPAWPLKSMPRVLEWCQRAHLAVLGGDVMRKASDGVECTWDNWAVGERQPQEPWASYVARSCQVATDYLQYFSTEADEQLLFSIVAVDEPTYSLLSRRG